MQSVFSIIEFTTQRGEEVSQSFEAGQKEQSVTAFDLNFNAGYQAAMTQVAEYCHSLIKAELDMIFAYVESQKEPLHEVIEPAKNEDWTGADWQRFHDINTKDLAEIGVDYNDTQEVDLSLYDADKDELQYKNEGDIVAHIDGVLNEFQAMLDDERTDAQLAYEEIQQMEPEMTPAQTERLYEIWGNRTQNE